MARLTTEESNRRAYERKKDAWWAKGNVIRLVDKRRIEYIFRAEEDSRRQN